MPRVGLAAAAILVLCAAPATAAPSDADQTFRGPTAENWTLAGDATLTAAAGPDAAGEGWLRLTPAVNDKMGSAISRDAFSSASGIAARFRLVAFGGTSTPADGTSFFLVDGSALAPSAGARGGGLGYANTCLEGGATDAYVGVGFDEYGNFPTNNECRNGGTPSLKPNSVALRGPAQPGDPFGGYQLLSTTPLGESLTSAGRAGARDVLLWVTSAGRATVRLRSPGGAWTTPIRDVAIGAAPPATLKAGFAASTGGLNNIHEVRDFIAGSPTDLQVTVSDGSATANPGATLIYTVIVRNNGPQTVAGAGVSGTASSNLAVDGWTCSADGGGSCDAASGTGQLDTTATLPAGAEARYRVTARIHIETGTAPTFTAAATPPSGWIDVEPGDESATDTNSLLFDPPRNTAVPQISGTPSVGATLTATQGEWLAQGPTTYAYAWERCEGATCTPIADATATTYRPVSADVGRTLRVRVTADNPAPGTVDAHSAATAPVSDPQDVTPPMPPGPVLPAPVPPAPVLPAPVLPAPVLPAPTAPAPCENHVSYGVLELNTRGCFERGRDRLTGDPQVRTTAAATVNGIPVPASGTGRPSLIATLPPGEEIEEGRKIADGPPPRDGKVEIDALNIALRTSTPVAIHNGRLTMKVPNAHAYPDRSDAVVSEWTPPAGRLLGLPIRGKIALRLGSTERGHYAAADTQLELPSVFRAGPSQETGGLTGGVTFRLQDGLFSVDGLRLRASNAWLGKLRMESVCLSYVTGPGSVPACQAPELDGRPYITCNDDGGGPRWNGSGAIVLPTKTDTRIAVFGGVADGRVASLGGFADNLGRRAPVAQEVYLNRVGVGLCLKPPPFKLRGDMGVTVLPTGSKQTIGINGYLQYTDAWRRCTTITTRFGKRELCVELPWELELGGNVNVLDHQIGSGSLTIRPTGMIDFDARAAIRLGGIVSVDGGLAGWLETRRRAFNIDGHVHACVGSVFCRQANAVVSSTGMGACATLFSFPVFQPYWFGVRVFWIPVRAGFGYRYGGGVSAFGGSCDLERFRTSRPAGVRAAAASGGDRIVVEARTPVVAVRVVGRDASPAVTLRGPRGETVSLPAGQTGARTSDGSMIVQNPTDNTTSIMLVRPAAGSWEVTADPGSPAIERVESASYEPPAKVVGRVRRGRRGARAVTVFYSKGTRDTVRLVEEGRGVQRTLAARLQGRACGQPMPDGRRTYCATVPFTPARGPGGRRRIVAVVDRDHVPTGSHTVATYVAPSPARPGKPRRLRIVRRKKSVAVLWNAARGVERYNVSVALSSGQRSARLLPPGCTSVALKPAPAGTAMRVVVVGVREDMAAGPAARISLRSQRRRAGPKPRTPRSQWRKNASCR